MNAVRLCDLCRSSDSPKTEFVLSSYTQPKELLFAIKELTFLGGDTNTGEPHTCPESLFTVLVRTVKETQDLEACPVRVILS